MGFKRLGFGKHLRITDLKGRREYYSSKSLQNTLILRTSCLLNLVKHVLNPLGLAKYEIRHNNQVVADVK